jgi:hypothetical protein
MDSSVTSPKGPQRLNLADAGNVRSTGVKPSRARNVCSRAVYSAMRAAVGRRTNQMDTVLAAGTARKCTLGFPG